MGLLEGKKLRDAIDALALVSPGATGKLTPKQRGTQSIIGSLAYTDRVHIENALGTHALSCVMSSPGDDAAIVARSMLYQTYKARKCGVTYGGANFESRPATACVMSVNYDMSEGAPSVTEIAADATWADRSRMGIIVTKAGGVVAHSVKLLKLILASSTEAEAMATARSGEIAVVARAIDKGLGCLDPLPMFVATDNRANALIASGQGSASRMRHAARRYHTFLQRVKSGDVRIGKVDDSENPSDWLTKWVGHEKMDRSLEYTKNRRNRVDIDEVLAGAAM